MSQRFCSQCATPVAAGMRFCPACAAPITSHSASSLPSTAAARAVDQASDYPDDGTGCLNTLAVLALFLGGVGVIMFGLMLAGLSLGPGTPQPILTVAGLASAVFGVVLILLARRAGGACPKCGNWNARQLDGEEGPSKRDAKLYHCSACAHRWREGGEPRPTPDDPA